MVWLTRLMEKERGIRASGRAGTEEDGEAVMEEKEGIKGRIIIMTLAEDVKAMTRREEKDGEAGGREGTLREGGGI